MNILVLNGSPRKGNCVTAINAFVSGVSGHSVEVVDTYKLKVGPCMGCDACGCANGCVAKDDTNMIVDKIVAADMVVIASPVYWWGISAQMKLVIDKCYCRGSKLGGKKVGIFIIGGSPVTAEQYRLIRGQFNCIASYLSWDIVFHEDFYASAATDLAGDASAIDRIKALGEKI